MLEDEAYQVQACGSSQQLRNQEKRCSRLVRASSEASAQVSINGSQIQPVIQRQQYMGDDEIADGKPQTRLHVSHVDAAHHAGNRHKRNSGERCAYHAKRYDEPRRLAVATEKSVVVGMSVGGESGYQQQKPEVKKYRDKDKSAVHDESVSLRGTKIYRKLVNLPAQSKNKKLNQMNQQYPSVLLEKAVGEFAKLPGIGRKTAMRLVLHLLRQDAQTVEAFAGAIVTLKREVKYCKVCHNISDTDVCRICSNPARDASTICVVENIRDVMAVENTQQFKGLYHVLGGVISPMDGIGPSDLQIDSLVERVKGGSVKEVILALSSTMEGDTTNFYIFRKLSGLDVKLTVIARGISIGDELEYTDEVTLGRSIVNRIAFTGTM